jgi:hypothetical protein
MGPPDSLDDLSRFRLPEPPTVPAPKPRRQKPPQPRSGENFLKGPVPWRWLTQAARQPGQALAVALAVWYRAGLEKAGQVTLSLSSLSPKMGVSRDAARRGLAALEAAGLIAVERYVGRKPVITILAWPEDAAGSEKDNFDDDQR